MIEAIINPAEIGMSNDDDEIYLMYKNLSSSRANSNAFVLGINCGDWRQCNRSILNYTNKTICCSGFGSCQFGSGLLTANEIRLTILIVHSNSCNDKNKNSCNLIGIY